MRNRESGCSELRLLSAYLSGTTAGEISSPLKVNYVSLILLLNINRPFYRYGGHSELIRFIGYPGGMSAFRLYFRALFGPFSS